MSSSFGTVLTRVNSDTGRGLQGRSGNFCLGDGQRDRRLAGGLGKQDLLTIKKLDPNHLVINGNVMIGPIASPERLAEKDADIYVEHYYEHWSQPDLAPMQRKVTKAGKVMIVEELAGTARTASSPNCRST